MLILTRVPVHLSGFEERLLCAVVALYSEHIIKMSAPWNDKCLLFSAFHVSATVQSPAQTDLARR